MLGALLVLLSLCLSAWLWHRWGAVRRYWAVRGVHHQPPSPLFGSLTFLVKQDSKSWLRYSKDLRLPYIGIWLFWRPALLINCPDIARRILVADSNNFRDRLAGSGTRDAIGYLNLFLVNDPTWSSIRRRLSPAFISTKVKAVESLVHNKCYELVQRINNEIKSGKKTDLRALYSDFTTDTISESIFGRPCNATLSGVNKVADAFTTYNWHRTLSWFTAFFLPEWTNLLRTEFYPDYVVGYYRKVFREVMKQKDEAGPKTKNIPYFLDALVQMKAEALKEGEDVTEDLLVAQAVVFASAGFDTTALSLSYATYELAFSPDIQEKLYSEVSEANRNNGELNSEILKTLVFLNAVIKEILRLHPIIAWLDRVAHKAYKIDDSLTIEAKTPVYINVASIHHNPDYFPNPHEFIPSRFFPENSHNIKPFTNMPFGEGPRNCIGMRFAMQTLQKALASVVLNFEFRPLPGSTLPRKFPKENKGLILLPGDTLSVEFVPRTPGALS